MDDMLNVIEHVYAPLGQKEPPWGNSGEFEETAALLNRSNSYSTADETGLPGWRPFPDALSAARRDGVG